MNHGSPIQKEKVLFKLTLTKSNAMEKTFRLVRGNEKGFFKVRKDKNVNLLYRTMLILTANDVENLQLKNQFV